MADQTAADEVTGVGRVRLAEAERQTSSGGERCPATPTGTPRLGGGLTGCWCARAHTHT